MRQTQKKVVKNPIVERIIDTLEVRSISQNELVSYLGLGNGAFTRWKYDGGKSYMKYIDQIASFLNVSKDYLLYGNTDDESVTLLPSDVESYRKLRELTEEQRSHILEEINLFWELNNRVC
jgi:transcriptional regulator with XRE-family HTH domain